MDLVFDPLVMLKVKYLCHLGRTEVGGFGVILEPEKKLYVSEFHLVPQVCTGASVEFDDAGKLEFTQKMLARGLRMDQFSRLKIHTHPGFAAIPSHTDEQDFKDSYGSCHWAIMMIMGRNAQTYARLRVKACKPDGPALEQVLNVVEDIESLSDCGEKTLDELFLDWELEYYDNVNEPLIPQIISSQSSKKEERSIVTLDSDLEELMEQEEYEREKEMFDEFNRYLD